MALLDTYTTDVYTLISHDCSLKLRDCFAVVKMAYWYVAFFWTETKQRYNKDIKFTTHNCKLL
ncbi:hypothetical protein BBBOND_0204170 [Babesia bigemina]|uniref:Uncharacterized protein n=1 Tax=Babesia bigemina TaxID=5866 RepID=A0A061D8M3_BABBI|nr:hypothetical protein BBBOND_0204170 [Babesia bigemina]CDR95259.1 hypothetical protein BBBOND_0204170 [Babesia bigemina]|eukprot:XP_012767445.1 hypothetical protein BBBOND_0204170 [Babesia bigemina]